MSILYLFVNNIGTVGKGSLQASCRGQVSVLDLTEDGRWKCPVGCKKQVGQREGMVGDPQDLRDRDRRWEKNHPQTEVHNAQRA